MRKTYVYKGSMVFMEPFAAKIISASEIKSTVYALPNTTTAEIAKYSTGGTKLYASTSGRFLLASSEKEAKTLAESIKDTGKLTLLVEFENVVNFPNFQIS